MKKRIICIIGVLILMILPFIITYFSHDYPIITILIWFEVFFAALLGSYIAKGTKRKEYEESKN